MTFYVRVVTQVLMILRPLLKSLNNLDFSAGSTFDITLDSFEQIFPVNTPGAFLVITPFFL